MGDSRDGLEGGPGAGDFVGAGAIGPGIGSLGSVPARTTYGAGFRFKLSPKENVNFNVDYAGGRSGRAH